MQTVKEVRLWAGTQPYSIRNFIDYAKDQKIRELISDADMEGIDVTELIQRMVPAPKQKSSKPKPEPKTEKPSQEKPKTRRRVKEGCVTVNGVVLTPKQLEFMERLPECPEWGKDKENGRYLVSGYAEELSDTMNPISVGAMVTTLREKELLITERVRVDGARGCMFTLTDKGKQVYRSLAGVYKTEVQYGK